MHTVTLPPADVSPVAHAVHPSVVVVAPVASDYLSAAQVLSVHFITLPPAENPPAAHAVHPSDTFTALLVNVVYYPAGQI